MQNWKIYSSLNVKMMRYKFQINFIFVFYVIIQVNFSFLQARKQDVNIFFDEEKCVNTNCCDDLRNFPSGIVCIKSMNSIYSKYFLEFTDIKYLPERVFQEQFINFIEIEAPDLTADSNVLDGMSTLESLYVKRSSIKAVPDFKSVKDSIWLIHITSSLLTSLEGGNLQNLTMLSTLKFTNNLIHYIDPNVFKGTENLRELDLSYNRLTFIPENLLDPIKKLDEFIAGNNNLLHVNNVFTVTFPHSISLRNNNITDISSALLKFEKDDRERASKCREESYRPTFRSQVAIKTLDLGNNSIKETSQSIFPCKHHFPHTSWSVFEIHHFKLHENNIKNLNFLLRYLIIRILEISKNQIEYLTDEDFKYTVGIFYLELWENKIKRIDIETFRPLRPHLQYLDMSWNSITSLNGSMRFLINLRTLILARNSIKSFATDEFLGLEELTALNLEHNQIKTIEFLQQLHRLQDLVITGNDIESVRPDLVSETLQRINLADNPIKCNCLLDLFIRRLNASSVQTDIYTICSKHVSDVNVPKKFNSQDLCTYRCTQYKNDSYTFVDCSSNNLAVVPQFPENYFADVEMAGTEERYAWALKKYQDSRVQPIKRRKTRKRLGHTVKSSLDPALLQGSSVSRIKTSQQAGPSTAAPVIFHEMAGTEHQSNQRITCCRTKYQQSRAPLTRRRITRKRLGRTVESSLDPALLQGSSVSRIKTSQQAGPSTAAPVIFHEMTDTKHRSNQRNTWRRKKYQNSRVQPTKRRITRKRLGRSVESSLDPALLQAFSVWRIKSQQAARGPQILTSDIFPNYYKHTFDQAIIGNIPSYTFHIEDKILGISLENNNLESLDTAQLPPNLIQLYLSENKLRRLPKSILENQRDLKQVTLSGNPWKCDCDAIKFKKWLTSEKEKITDIDNVRCGIIGNEDSRLNGRVIIDLTDLELCPTDIALIVLAPSGALTVIIFCLVSTILYTRYKLNIKVFLYSHGITFVREEDLDYNKIFDAFISFSDNDGELVTNDIISVIEKRNPNIHLCFHIRDFIPGELITTNITRAVQNSKKTVLILSKNFLESEWCLLEARTAHSQAMEDKVHRIIVIKVGDLPKEMNPLIKVYLVSTTYITWGESNFWNKLLYVLPSHVSSKGNVPDNMGDNESVL